MHKNEWLYGTVDVPEIDNYVIARRIEILKEHLDDLIEVYYMDRDSERIRAVLKAIDFWSNINNKENI